jgi:hypothetical protein
MKRFTNQRKEAFDETVGNRYHLYEHTNPRTKHYSLGPMRKIPFQTYTFVLHDDCTRKVYKQLKALQQEATRVHQTIHPRSIPGFGSRARSRGKPYGKAGASVFAGIGRDAFLGESGVHSGTEQPNDGKM